MKDFLRSTKFKILVAVLIVILAFSLRAAYTGGISSMFSQGLGFIITPLQKLSSSISNAAGDFFYNIFRAGEIADENEQLKAQLAELQQKLGDYEQYKHENEQLKEYLDIKEENPDYEFTPASVIERDPTARFGSFTIDQGSLSGVSQYDPVITGNGVVGYVSEVGLTYSKVTTILDVAMEMGAYDVSTRDSGVVTGEIELADQGLCKMILLPRESGAAVGDLIMTTGVGGVFPSDLIVGTITEIHTETHGLSLYALVRPAADPKTVKDVLVITSFRGQGGN